MGISLGSRAWPGLITKTDSSFIEIFFQFQNEKCKVKFCKGYPLRRDHTWVYHLGSGRLRRTSTRPTTIQDRYPVVENPSILNWKTQNKNLQGIPPSDGFTHGHITWIGLGLGLDIRRMLIPHQQGLYPSYAHPLETPRKLNFQPLTSVGNSHTQQFLTWVYKDKGGGRNIFISVRVFLTFRTFSPFQMSGDKCFVDTVISMMPKSYWARILCQQNLPLIFTQE